MARLLALLAASTAFTAIGASAAMADPDFVAGISAGVSQYNGTGVFAEGSADLEGYQVRGSVSASYNFTPVLGVQGDVVVRFDTSESEGTELNVTGLDGALHAFYRDPSRFLLGGFVQIGRDNLEIEGGPETSADRSYLGVEGQVFLDQFTVYGQLGLQNMSPEYSEADAEGWFVTAELRYFLTPDFKIEAHAGRSELNTDFGANLQIETVNVGFGAEYKFADLPFSVFGQYDFTTSSINAVPDSSVDSHRVLVGLKFNMGEQTLQDRDRSGASLKPFDINALPVLSYGGGVGP